MTETCFCPKHGIVPVAGAECFVCVQEGRSMFEYTLDVFGNTIKRPVSDLGPNMQQMNGPLQVPLAERVDQEADAVDIKRALHLNSIDGPYPDRCWNTGIEDEQAKGFLGAEPADEAEFDLEDPLFDPDADTRSIFALPEWKSPCDDPDLFEPLSQYEPPSSASEICAKAAAIVEGKRAAQHGPKERNHKNIAILWEAYMQLKKANNTFFEGWDGLKLTAWDVATMMELLKIARRFAGAGRQNVDNYVDGAGYAGIAGEIALNGEEEGDGA